MNWWVVVLKADETGKESGEICGHCIVLERLCCAEFNVRCASNSSLIQTHKPEMDYNIGANASRCSMEKFLNTKLPNASQTGKTCYRAELSADNGGVWDGVCSSAKTQKYFIYEVVGAMGILAT